MATAETDTKTALQELLDERQRYEGWLRALEDRRDATPPHVYQRVHTDYTLRLERVTQRLRERAEQLTATIEGMRTRLQSLRSREADRTDERHEFELRAAVGELSPEEWSRRRDEADRELAAIADDRRSVEAELGELDRIVALTREPAPRGPDGRASEADAVERADEAAASSGGFEPEEEPVAPEAPAVAGSAGAIDRGEHHPLAAAADPGAPSIDDFVADWPVRQMARPEGGDHAEAPVDAGTSPATATWHPPASGAGSAAAAGLAGMAGSGGRADAAPPAHQPHADSAPASAAHDHAHEQHAQEPQRIGMAGDGRRDADKTLKCPECGAMNYATEWYCERCGGELASF